MSRLLLILFCFNTTLHAQIAVGETLFQTKLYTQTQPHAFNDYNVPKSQIITTVPNGSKVIAIGKVDYWVKVVFNKDSGWLQRHTLYFSSDQEERLKNLTTNSGNSYSVAVKYLELIEQDKQIEEKNEKLRKSKIVDAISKNGFGFSFSRFYYDGDFVSYTASITNTRKSSIKYVWATLSIYNPVNDLISSKTVQMVGPIASMESGSYNFETVFFTKVFNWGKVSKVKVQYFDGVLKELRGAAIQSIIFE